MLQKGGAGLAAALRRHRLDFALLPRKRLGNAVGSVDDEEGVAGLFSSAQKRRLARGTVAKSSAL